MPLEVFGGETSVRGFHLESGLIPFVLGAPGAGLHGRVSLDPLEVHLSGKSGSHQACPGCWFLEPLTILTSRMFLSRSLPSSAWQASGK